MQYIRTNATPKSLVNIAGCSLFFFLRLADETATCLRNLLACSASISAIGSVPAHSTRDQLLLPRALSGDNGGMSKAENQVAGKRRSMSRLPYKCRAQSPVKITRSLISSRERRRKRIREWSEIKRFLVQKSIQCEETIFCFRILPKPFSFFLFKKK